MGGGFLFGPELSVVDSLLDSCYEAKPEKLTVIGKLKSKNTIQSTFEKGQIKNWKWEKTKKVTDTNIILKELKQDWLRPESTLGWKSLAFITQSKSNTQ